MNRVNSSDNEFKCSPNRNFRISTRFNQSACTGNDEAQPIKTRISNAILPSSAASNPNSLLGMEKKVRNERVSMKYIKFQSLNLIAKPSTINRKPFPKTTFLFLLIRNKIRIYERSAYYYLNSIPET